MYADDTSVAHTSSSINDITKSINAELENLIKLLHGNKLTSNVANTTSMIIGKNRKLDQSNNRELIQAQMYFKILGEAIVQKRSVKY